MNVVQVSFCVFRYCGFGWCVCVVSVGLVDVEVFVGSCYFVQLVALMSILLFPILS